jgi:signal transduction histidine kinase
MIERAEMAGGWCRVSSKPGAGTTVEVWVPVA